MLHWRSQFFASSQAIKTILDDLHGRVEGTSIRLRDSLEHLHDLDDTEAMRELLSLHGVGPKAAACVLSYALGREIFAIDTSVPPLPVLCALLKRPDALLTYCAVFPNQSHLSHYESAQMDPS